MGEKRIPLYCNFTGIPTSVNRFDVLDNDEDELNLQEAVSNEESEQKEMNIRCKESTKQVTFGIRLGENHVTRYKSKMIVLG